MSKADRINKLRADAAKLGYSIRKISDPLSLAKRIPKNWSTKVGLLSGIPDKDLRNCRFSKAFLGNGILNALARSRINTRHELLLIEVPSDLLEYDCIGPKSINLIDKWRSEIITDFPVELS